MAAILIAVWAAVISFASTHFALVFDDAYIFMRYAENFFKGCPLAFNCADGPVEGYSSPAYLFALILARLFTDDLEFAAQALGPLLMSAAISITALTAAHRRFGAGNGAVSVALVGVVAGALALDHNVLIHAASGMEVGLAMLAVSIVALAALDEKLGGLRAAIVFAVLTRPECALFALLLPVFPKARNGRYFIWILVPGVAIATARLAIFGDILPNAFWAKSGGDVHHLALGFEYIEEILADHPAVALSPLALLNASARRPVLYIIGASLLWFLFFLWSGGDSYGFHRLAMPVIPALTMLSVVGIWSLLSGAIARLKSGRASAALPVVMTAALFAVQTIRAAKEHRIEPHSGIGKVQRWVAVGRYLNRFAPNTKVAAAPIGAIGYFSGLQIVDILGVTDPTIAKEGKRIPEPTRDLIGHECYYTEYVLAKKPDVIVTTRWSEGPFPKDKAIEVPRLAEWELVEAIRDGRADYVSYTPEVAPGIHWLMFLSRDFINSLGEKSDWTPAEE